MAFFVHHMIISLVSRASTAYAYVLMNILQLSQKHDIHGRDTTTLFNPKTLYLSFNKNQKFRIYRSLVKCFKQTFIKKRIIKCSNTIEIEKGKMSKDLFIKRKNLKKQER